MEQDALEKSSPKGSYLAGNQHAGGLVGMDGLVRSPSRQRQKPSLRRAYDGFYLRLLAY